LLQIKRNLAAGFPAQCRKVADGAAFQRWQCCLETFRYFEEIERLFDKTKDPAERSIWKFLQKVMFKPVPMR
jgi:hypothetical protein